MHEDAERRMSDFLQQLHRPRSIASRVQEMLPLIDEARTRGATWPEISEVLGVPRSTLLAAYSRARKSSGGKAKARGSQRKAEPPVPPDGSMEPVPEPLKKAEKARKVERWSG